MRSIHLMLVALIGMLVVGGVLGAGQPAPAPPAQPPGATRVAIANTARIFNDMAETKALREKLEVRRKELLAKEKEMRDGIDTLIQRRQSINPKHPSYREISDQIDKAKADFQAWGLATKASVERDQKEMLLNLYEKIETATQEVAAKNGIDLVITDGRSDLANAEEATADELRRVLNARNVVYAAKHVDISEMVITVLDAKYAQNGGAVGGAGQPVPLPK